MIAKKKSGRTGARRRFLPAAAACVAAFTSPAYAAEPPSGNVLDEVIVTAQKREQRLQDIPFTVTAIDESSLKDANVLDFQDVALLTPGVEIVDSLGRQTENIAIRGLVPSGLTAEPTVLVYLNGFTLGFSRVQNNAKYFDLERIEVLKGPQATLYGRNSLGGVINVITKKPGNELEGSVKSSFGNFDSREVSGSLSGPLVTDKLSMGIAARYGERGGFLDNTLTGERNVNDESDANAQFQLRATPGEATKIDLTVTYSESNDGCGGCANSLFPGYSPADRAAVGRGTVDFNSPTRTVNEELPGSFDRATGIAVLNIEHPLGSMTFNSVTGYADTASTLVTDINGTAGDFFGIRGVSVRRTSNVLSQELRLSSDTRGRFQWLAGLFAYSTDLGRVSTRLNPAGNSIGRSTDNVTTVNNYAAFGNGEYRFTDHWSLGVGLRWDYEDIKLNDKLGRLRRETTDHQLLPKISLAYAPNERMNLYASAARGYRAGGFNEAVAPVGVFAPEFVWQYELGIKGRAWERAHLRYEAAAYFIDWQDRQQGLLVPSGPGAGLDYVDNAGSAIVRGVEGSISIVPLQGLTLQTSVSLAHSEIRNFINQANAPKVFGWNPDYSGNSLAYTPKVSATFSGQYVRPTRMAGWDLRVRADARYTGQREFDDSDALTQDPYTVVNAYVGIQSERWQLGVYADNVFDTEYYSAGAISTFSGPLLEVGTPRSYGVRLRADF